MGATHLPKTFQDCLPLVDHLLLPHNDPLKIPHQYFTDGSFLKGSESRSVESDSLRPHGLYSPWNSPGPNTGVGSLSFLQGIFPTQGSNPGPLHCRWILNNLSHQESQRILEWGAYPFSRGSYWPRKWTGVPCIAGRFFTNWTIMKALFKRWQWQTPSWVCYYNIFWCVKAASLPMAFSRMGKFLHAYLVLYFSQGHNCQHLYRQ